jgi:RNA polymerase sigma-70 factor (ECF subfamily)
MLIDVRSLCRSEDLNARFEAEAVPLLPRFYPAALRLTGNLADAEDLIQEMYLRAFRGYSGAQSGTYLTAWLHRILRNAFIDGYRKRRREPETVFEDWSPNTNVSGPNVEASAEATVIDSIPDAQLQDALSSLPEAHRRVVLLYDVEGFTRKEIASMVGAPVGTVASRLHRGRKALRERMLTPAGSPGLAA